MFLITICSSFVHFQKGTEQNWSRRYIFDDFFNFFFLIIFSLFLWNIFVPLNVVRTLTASVNNDIGLDENCPLLRPVEKGEDVPVDIRFYKDEDYFPEWMNNQTLNETLLSGPVDVDPLNVRFLGKKTYWRRFRRVGKICPLNDFCKPRASYHFIA